MPFFILDDNFFNKHFSLKQRTRSMEKMDNRNNAVPEVVRTVDRGGGPFSL